MKGTELQTRPPFILFVSAAWALCRDREESDKEKLDLKGEKDSNQDGEESIPSH